MSLRTRLSSAIHALLGEPSDLAAAMARGDNYRTNLCRVQNERDAAQREAKALADDLAERVAACPACGEGASCDEDRCCSSCGRDLIVCADGHSADMLEEALTEARAEKPAPKPAHPVSVERRMAVLQAWDQRDNQTAVEFASVLYSIGYPAFNGCGPGRIAEIVNQLVDEGWLSGKRRGPLSLTDLGRDALAGVS
jgi:hypothetical protein